eukprot:CAMPEP_0172731098 /NCGR_PEP_ID=MMETSP1074-20121228/100202_1 /TAXON_ID=2916 /ORGANISM="Ceratium fusus, Strain PA161109" /LENGTH=81 /DNA_ID=CAMNT_0013559009 /DNA_START=18 /DNA_END=260 /DNA_ORIENTATION=+
MAIRRPLLTLSVLAVVAVLVLRCNFGSSADATFTGGGASAPRFQARVQGGPANLRLVAVQALPEPRPNDAMLPVELNRTSL